MIRFIHQVLGIIGGLLLLWIIALLVLWMYSDEVVPFSTSTRLASGETVTVSGTESRGWDGDTNTEYTITLRFPNGQQEQVNHGYLSNERAPEDPFTLTRTPNTLILLGRHEIYHRPATGSQWQSWNYREDEAIPALGRALTPTNEARGEKFGSNGSGRASYNGLPDVPPYTFERYARPSGFLVMRQLGSPASNGHIDALWPKRLLFRNWNLDVPRTLALEPQLRSRLRPLPQDVHVELLVMSFAPDFGWEQKIATGTYDKKQYHYENVRQIPGASLWNYDQWALSSRPHATPLGLWEGQNSRTTFTMRGLYADPNPSLVHCAWKIGSQPQHWLIAHNNEWMPIREKDGYSLVKPYLFARFSWPIRQTKLRHDLPRPRRHHASASRRSRRHDAVLRRAVR